MNCSVPTTTLNTAPLEEANSTAAHTNTTIIQSNHEDLLVQQGPLCGLERGWAHARTAESNYSPSYKVLPGTPTKRQVRFEQSRIMTNDCVTTATAPLTTARTMVSASGGVVEHCYFYPAIPRELYSDCFWSKAEIQQMQVNQVKLAQTYLSLAGLPKHLPQESSPLVRCIHLLYGLHGDNDNGIDNNRHEHSKTSNDNHSSRTTMASSKATMAAIFAARRALASSNHRGLEPLLTPWLNQHRLCITHQVLALQRDCWVRGKSLAARSEILAHFCDCANEAPRHYAHQLALGDEEFAQQESKRRMFDEPLKRRGVDKTQPQEDNTQEETHVNDVTTPQLPDCIDVLRSRLSLQHQHQSGRGREGRNGLARRAISFLSQRRGNLFSAIANEN